MELKLDVGCAENFYGLNCNFFCTESRSVCEGSSDNNIIILHGDHSDIRLVNTCRISNSNGVFRGERHSR